MAQILDEHVAELLADIDGIEADLRRLENRLTYVRSKLHRLSGLGKRYGDNGRRPEPVPPAPRAPALPRDLDDDIPF
jgi:outer membrane protein TolC